MKSAKQLDGAAVCVQPGTTTELNLADYFRANNMTFKPVVIEKIEEVRAAFFSGRCDVYTTDVSGLFATRVAKLRQPRRPRDFAGSHLQRAVGPAVRQGDDQFDIVNWSQFAMIEAEEFGITSKNSTACEERQSVVQRFLGVTGDGQDARRG